MIILVRIVQVENLPEWRHTVTSTCQWHTGGGGDAHNDQPQRDQWSHNTTQCCGPELAIWVTMLLKYNTIISFVPPLRIYNYIFFYYWIISKNQNDKRKKCSFPNWISPAFLKFFFFVGWGRWSVTNFNYVNSLIYKN